MSVQDKEAICLAALNSPEGQAALAEALSGPIVMFATEKEREEFWSQPHDWNMSGLNIYYERYEDPRGLQLYRFLDVEEEMDA